ncbi:Uu.00g078660.m01.CDS01 [Anthostomella pinea]|uniref:Uu.00g078660.m01.CDS01 n=1 Tax=Anthostomella pinea TaxID=933095 RepID=A0AAI8VKM6_9PEZI|nr:Uu.00g078660.m01.CDS01 [Anthostomella pinea]
MDTTHDMPLSEGPSSTRPRDKDTSGLSPKRQRPRYSYLKCVRCRRDKKKCEPTGRRAGEKCLRCSEKGFDCSESQKSASGKAPKTRLPIQVDLQTGDEKSLVTHCCKGLAWLRMLRLVESAAFRIDESLQLRRRHISLKQGAVNSKVLYELAEAREIVEALVLKKLQSMKRPFSSDTQITLFRAATQAMQRNSRATSPLVRDFERSLFRDLREPSLEDVLLDPGNLPSAIEAQLALLEG